MKFKAQIMDEVAMNRALTRIAHEIIEKNKGIEDLALMGIQRRGVPLARKLADIIYEIEQIRLPIGILDITMYRDDLSLLSVHPILNSTDIPFLVAGKRIVIVDDVIYTGRTVRAAIEAIMDAGRAEQIQLAVMVDRGHRELPIRADYIGKNVPTSKNEVIAVSVGEIDGKQEVSIYDMEE